jgi:hypothetical protein
MIVYKLNKIDYKRKSHIDFADVIKMPQNDPRNYLYYHQNQEFQRNSDVTIKLNFIFFLGTRLFYFILFYFILF